MRIVKRIHQRLVGFRLYIVSALFALPEILEGLTGFDWATVLPDAYTIYAAKIGGGIALFRLIAIPAVIKMRRKARRDPCGHDHCSSEDTDAEAGPFAEDVEQV